MDKENFKNLADKFSNKSAHEILRYFFLIYSEEGLPGTSGRQKDRIALASSLGAEDQVLTHMVRTMHPNARIFVLDTGRLHSETYEVMDQTMKQYDMHYEILFPDRSEVEEMASTYGPNLFYESSENRKKCCHVRKVIPLQRILSTLDVWITGLRKQQAITRGTIEKIEWDEANGLIKFNPLVDWSEKEVWEYIRKNRIPYNKLHDEGYPSIGCAPCTRAIKPGEDVRAGRWWWEAPEQKECGLHVVDGKLKRKNQ